MLELYILFALVLAWACAPRKGKRRVGRQRPAKAAERPRTVKETRSRASAKVIDLAQIEAMQSQIDAACELGRAYDKQARDLQATISEAKARVDRLKAWGNMDYKVEELTRQIDKDETKRARLAQQSANAYARAATIQARIDRMTLAA